MCVKLFWVFYLNKKLICIITEDKLKKVMLKNTMKNY